MGEFVSSSKMKHGQAANVKRRSPEQVSAQAATNKRALSGTPRSTFAGRTSYKQSLSYKRWLSMKKRVKVTAPEVFKYYGAKGIKVCERWESSFENFLADMGECPMGLTLDRVDGNGHYEPGNCRWATWCQQAANRSSKGSG